MLFKLALLVKRRAIKTKHRRCSRNLGDFLGRGARLGNGLQFGDGGCDSLVDTALQIHRIHAGGLSFICPAP